MTEASDAVVGDTYLKYGINALFEPRAVAVIGASEDESKFGGRVMRNIVKYGFDGPIYPINRTGADIRGIAGYRSLTEVPGTVDLVVIAVPQTAVLGVLDECAAKHVRAVIVVSSGFAEAGDKGLSDQVALVKRAEQHGIAMLGPNSLGLYHARARLAVTASQVFDRALQPGSIAVLSQSGALGGSILDAGIDQGLAFSAFVSVGNGAAIEIPDLLLHQVADKSCRVIVLYVEGVRDMPRFAAALNAAQQAGKVIIVLRAGQSEKGACAVHSHTGSMAGTNAAYRALFKKYGAIEVSDVQEALDAARLAAFAHKMGRRIGFVSVSGGMGSLAADICEEVGLYLSDFEVGTVGKLQALLPSFAASTNPLDVTGAITSAPGLMEEVLHATLADPSVDVVVVLMTVVYGSEKIAEEIARVSEPAEKPLVTVVCGGTSLSGASAALTGARVPMFTQLKSGLESIARLADFAELQDKMRSRYDEQESYIALGSKINSVLSSAEGPMMTESDSKRILGMAGIPVCLERMVDNCDAAVEAAAEFGYPVVLKGVSTRIAHKAKAGLVKLNVCDEAQVVRCYKEIMEATRSSDNNIRAVTVQPMVLAGLELLIGGVRDPQAGPLVAFGLGGAFTECFRQITFRPAPVTRDEAREMLGEISVFQGSAGVDPAGATALSEMLAIVSQLMANYPRIAELDINPLIYYPSEDRGVAVDGLIQLVTANI